MADIKGQFTKLYSDGIELSNDVYTFDHEIDMVESTKPGDIAATFKPLESSTVEIKGVFSSLPILDSDRNEIELHVHTGPWFTPEYKFTGKVEKLEQEEIEGNAALSLHLTSHQWFVLQDTRWFARLLYWLWQKWQRVRIFLT